MAEAALVLDTGSSLPTAARLRGSTSRGHSAATSLRRTSSVYLSLFLARSPVPRSMKTTSVLGLQGRRSSSANQPAAPGHTAGPWPLHCCYHAYTNLVDKEATMQYCPALFLARTTEVLLGTAGQNIAPSWLAQQQVIT